MKYTSILISAFALTGCAVVSLPVTVVSTAADVATTTVSVATKVTGEAVELAADVAEVAIETKAEKSMKSMEIASSLVKAGKDPEANIEAEPEDTQQNN